MEGMFAIENIRIFWKEDVDSPVGVKIEHVLDTENTRIQLELPISFLVAMKAKKDLLDAHQIKNGWDNVVKEFGLH